MSPTDMDGVFFLMSGRSSWEKRKKADSGRLGALGSLPAFFDEPEAPRGIFDFFLAKGEECEDESEGEKKMYGKFSTEKFVSSIYAR